MSDLSKILVFLGAIIGGLVLISVALMVKGKLSPTDWFEYSLGIPKGTVRAILALIFAIITVWVLTVEVPEGRAVAAPPDWLLGILGAIIGFYFGVKGSDVVRREDIPGKLEQLKELHEKGAISDEDYQKKQSALLSRF